MENTNAIGYGNQMAAGTLQGVQGISVPPSLRGVCSRIEELHKEADTLFGLACDLVGHEPEKAGASVAPVPGSLVDQLNYSIGQLSTKLRSAREKFQRGHG